VIRASIKTTNDSIIGGFLIREFREIREFKESSAHKARPPP
jgi:hypothetical protein